MDIGSRSSKSEKFRWWFTRKKEKADSVNKSGEISDEIRVAEQNDCSSSSEMDPPCIATGELRIFVGTWNVAGRSPVGSLAVDLDEWLNLKDSADIYVLGFQEIVPLKTRTIIGMENQTEATNWNLLIGKTLNDKYGCPWLTSIINPMNRDCYYYQNTAGNSEIQGQQQPSFSRHGCPTPPNRNYGEGQSNRYKLIASKKMVGVFISVWIRTPLLQRYNISSVKVCSVACGIMGYLGNKGSVSVSMLIGGTSFCFVVAHLASGEKKGNECKRNHQVSEIFRRTSFSRIPQDGNGSVPLTILGHDRIFWFGDLNYRLYLEDNLARQYIRKRDWRALQKFDQLQKELDDGGVFQGWTEGDIEFAPTYKYSSTNRERYSGGVPSRVGEKQRTPAWCDRILWYGKGVKQISYFRSESKFSDHRPVSALFSTKIEVVKCANRRAIAPEPIAHSDGNPTKYVQDKAETLLSLIVESTEAFPNKQTYKANR